MWRQIINLPYLTYTLLLRSYLCCCTGSFLIWRPFFFRISLLAGNRKQFREGTPNGSAPSSLQVYWNLCFATVLYNAVMPMCVQLILSHDTASSSPFLTHLSYGQLMTLLCGLAVHLDPWPGMHLEVSAWPLVMTYEIAKWLEGAGGIYRQGEKLITWVETPCSQHLGAFCFLPDHSVSLSWGWWPNHW